MKNIMKFLGVSAVILLVLSGCGPAAHIEQSRNVNFNDYRTFAWIDKKQKREQPDVLQQRVKDAITYELQASRGWKEVTSNPDVLLSYDVSVERGTRLETDPWGPYGYGWGPYYGRFYNPWWGWGWGSYSYPVPIKEGTIGVTMIDARTNKAVLQGWATDEVGYRRMTGTEIDRIVKAIFKKWDDQGRYASRYDRYDRRPMTRDRYYNDRY